MLDSPKGRTGKGLRKPQSAVVPTVAPSKSDFAPDGAQSGAPNLAPVVSIVDADLQRVIDRWDSLPDALRSGIVAMVNASAGNEGV